MNSQGSFYVSYRMLLALSIVGLVLILAITVWFPSCGGSGKSGANMPPPQGTGPTAPPPPASLTPPPGQGSAATYFVSSQGNDAGDGSASTPWATIQHAADKAQPGTTIHVAPGVYFGALLTQTSGTGSARIRFVSDTRWGALIRSVGASQTWRNIGDFVDIVGFDVSGDGSIGILNEGSNVRIMENQVHDIPASLCDSDGGAAIDNSNYSGAGNDVIGNLIYNIGVSGCAVVHGIYHSNLGGHIWNNVVFRVQGWGIHLWHAATNVVVANNLTFGNGSGGILVGAGDAPGGITNDGTLVSNNIVIFNTAGIEEFGTTGKNAYLNNLLFANTTFALQLLTGSSADTLQTNPQIINLQSGDFRLSSSSPAIRTGTSTGAPPNDLNGNPRPQQNCDLGPLQANTGSQPAWPWD
jgi:hypothetical protein